MVIPKRSVVLFFYAVATVPLAVVLGGSVWLCNDLYGASDRFGQVVENGTSGLVPTDPDSFMRDDAPTGSGDAAPAFTKLAEKWEEIPTDARTKLVADVRLYSMPGDNPRDGFAAAVSKCQPYIEGLNRAAQFPDSRFEREWTGQSDLIEPHYHTTIQFGRLMGSLALADAREGRIDKAFTQLHRLRQIGQHLSRDSGLDGLVTHVNLETLALSAAVEIAMSYGGRDGVIAAYESFLTDRSTRPDAIRNLQGEAMRSVYVLSRAESFDDRMFNGSKLSMRNTVFQRAAAVRMVEFWTNALELAQETGGDPLAVADSYLTADREFAHQRSPSRMIPQAVANWNGPRIEMAASLEARYALSQAISPLLRSFHESGGFPSEIESPLGLDPYTGNALAYTKTEKGIAIWCTGIDRIQGSGVGDSRDVSLKIEDGIAFFEGL